MPIRFLADQSIDRQLTIEGSISSNPLLRLLNTSNGSGAKIEFSDQTSQLQFGEMTFYHSDGSSYGSGASFQFTSAQGLSVLADGKLLFKDGLYLKPSSGTGTTGSQLITSAGAYKIPSIVNAGTDTDKFLVLDSDGNVDFRTGAEVRSDIGAGTGSGSVTSVGITAGTGISVSGSPITSSGSITVTNSSPDTGVPAILSDGTSPSLNTGITGAEVRSLIGAGTGSGTVTGVGATSPINSSGGTSPTISIDNATGTTVGAAAIQAGTGISVSDNNGVYTITNSSPSSGGTVTGVTGTAPIVSSGGTAPAISINNATGTTVGACAIQGSGVGISVSDSNGVYTISNSGMISWTVRGDSGTDISIGNGGTVDIAGGTGISTVLGTSGVIPTLTITNDAPDQTVALTAGTGISVSGTYPNFTITNSSPSSGGTMSTWKLTADSGGTATIDDAETVDIAGGTNITTVRSGNTVTINTSATTNTGTVTSVGITAGTGISVSGSPVTSSGSITVTNSAPDQTVALTGGTGITISGTYPNFTITNSAPASGGITGSGTSGKVAKFTGSSSIGDGDITFGTNTITLGDPTSSSTATLFVDTQNRRVGYRTINPTSAFEVVGTINTQGLNCNEKQFFSPKDNNYIQAGNYGNGEFFGNSGFGNDDKQPKFSGAWGNSGIFVEHQKIETIKIQQNGFYNWFTNGCILIPAQGTNTFILVDSITVYKSAGSNPNMGQVYFGFCEQASPTSNCQMFGNQKSFQFWGSIASQVTSRSGTWMWQSNRPYNVNNSEAADTASLLNRPFIARVGQNAEVSSGTFNGPWYIQIKYRNVNYLAGFVNNVDRTVTSTGSGQNSRTLFLGSTVENFNTICPANANVPPDADQSYYYDNTSGCNGNNGYPASGDKVYTSATGSTVASAGYIYLYSGGGSRYYIQIGASGVVQGSSCSDSVSECDQPDS